MITTPDYDALADELGDPDPVRADLAAALDAYPPEIPQARGEETER